MISGCTHSIPNVDVASPDYSTVIRVTPRLVPDALWFFQTCTPHSKVFPGADDGCYISPVHSGNYPPCDSGPTTPEYSSRLLKTN